MKKQILAILLSLFLLGSNCVYSHSGRTDSSGGHKDNKNKSGLGYYHYHCGGYPAHLHPNGVCPYSTENTSSSVGYSSSTKTTNVTRPMATVPSFSVKLDGVDLNSSTSQYPPVFFNNVTYIPLTSDIITFFNFEYRWDENEYIRLTANLNSNSETVFKNSFTNGTNSKGQKVEISKSEKNLIINSNIIELKNTYPLIKANNINYIPLTSDVISKLNLTGSWNEIDGFILSSSQK
ncbi:YHYH domain-containing protein [Peptostreptococcaceae bacterium AGR-M142]